MKILTLVAGMVLAGVVSASPGDAQPLRYWGKQPGAATGWIDLDYRQDHEIGVGTDIPGWGRVKEVHDHVLVIEHVRTDAEKQRLQEEGALVTDVLELHIPRADLRHPRWESAGGTRRSP